MDHLLANSDNPIPAPDQQGPAPAGDDEDEDDKEALAAHIKKMGGTVNEDDLVAKVRSKLDVMNTWADVNSRSNAVNVARRLDRKAQPVSTLRSRAIKSLKSRQMR